MPGIDVDEREDMEHVPWADLMAQVEPEDRRRKALYQAAGFLGALVVGVIVARSWWAAPVPPVPIAPGTTIVPAEGSGGTTPTLPLYSEADLMADPPDPSARAAITRAEWFVTDFFTADLEPSGSAEVRAALPGWVTADLAQEGSDSVSYVEWARAFRVEEAGGGLYRVAVAFRALGAPPDRGFTRLPVRAVEVLVAVGEDGGTTVVDLPEPVALPPGPEPEEPGWVEGSPPQSVVDTVSARASVWGSEPRILSAVHLDGDWRVVVSVADAVGLRWPLAMRVAEG